MGLPAEKRRPATYADLEAVPSHLVAEIMNGELRTMPRPPPKHTNTSSALGYLVGAPFGFSVGGPGGWTILDQPELHLGPDILVPDLAGWTRERMPRLPEIHFDLAPDWVCEVLSPSTAASDRADKMPIYARENVQFAWLIDPTLKTLEVFVLNPDRRWLLAAVHRGEARVRAEPFDAIEIDLALLWAK
jgi:Uma2 family endonuclease